ncbi:MAG: hypothetical protein A2X36_07930 [Elusimicrobia bacterium GWA2_69_24]|nr:MAG: hypothetical protein A2X36_07930 [Elusimicrobia bacterium GWA2_69_24]
MFVSAAVGERLAMETERARCRPSVSRCFAAMAASVALFPTVVLARTGGPTSTIADACFGKDGDVPTCAQVVWALGGWPLLVLVGVVVLALWLWLSAVTSIGGSVKEAFRSGTAWLVQRGEIARARRRYLDAALAEYAELGFRVQGIGRLKLGRTYVSLRLAPGSEQARPDAADGSAESEGMRERAGRAEPAPVSLAEAVGDCSRLAIVGAAGSSKSTLLRWAGFAVAQNRLGRRRRLSDEQREFLDALGRRRLTPVLVPLKEFNRSVKDGAAALSPDGLLAFLQERAKLLDLPATFFREEFRQGCLLLLDGLDEVDLSDRHLVREIIEELIRRPFENGGHRCLLTSRIDPYLRTEVSGLRACTVEPLTPAQRNVLIANVYAAIHESQPEEASRRTDDLQKEIDHNDPVRALAITPLMVTIFTALHARPAREGRGLPRQRSEVYEEAVTYLLTAKHTPGEPSLSRDEIEPRHRGLALAAFELHQRGDRGDTARRDDMVELIHPLFGAAPEAARKAAVVFLEAVTDRGGLLEERDGWYGFYSHPTFREFLAGCHLAALPPETQRSFLAARLGDDRWVEPVRLAAGYLAITSAERPNEFVQRLAALGEGAEQRAHALALAGVALSDLPREVVNAETTKAVAGPARDLLETNPPPVAPQLRRGVGLALGWAGDARLKPGAIPELVRVSEGRFRMGSNAKDAEFLAAQDFPVRDYERTAGDLLIFVSEFEIGRYPVTNAEFRAFWQGTRRYQDLGIYLSPEGRQWLAGDGRREPGLWDDPRWNAPNLPVVGVTWHEADAYCRWLGTVTGQPFRLPTEAEWEKAARGEDGRLWPWGNEWHAAKCNSDGSLHGTSPVGMYPDGVSPYGALDMVGNVFEWCQDGWDEKAYEKLVSRPIPDPGSSGFGAGSRVVRGGAWLNSRGFCRVASRDWDVPSNFHDYLGFRVVRAPVRG